MKCKKRSLFSRIFIINILIIFIAFSIITLIFYSRFYAYLRTEHENTILTASSKALELTCRTIEMNSEIDRLKQENPTVFYNYNKFKGQIEDNYRSTLATISTSTNFSVMRIAPDSSILFRYADISNFQAGRITSKHNAETGNRQEYICTTKVFDELVSGSVPQGASNVSYDGEDYFIMWGDMDKTFKTTTLTVLKPLYINGTLNSVLMLFIPTPQINYLLNIMTYNFIMAAIISLIVSMLLSYILSYRISKPLKAMNEAAMKLASGDFTKRVDANNKNIVGEIDELIVTFNDMAEALQNAEINQRSFTASIAHELRTPMTSIIGFIDSILDGTIPKEKTFEYLDICLSESRRLSKLVTDLMDASKIESGIQHLELSDFDINECIRRQIIKYESRLSEKNLDVAVEFDTDECICLCDKDSITRVIINLLDNAIKFSNESGKIKIDVRKHSGKAYITIANTGAGISQEDIKHIFDKFYKTDKSRSLDRNGIGLGLYLVKNIILLHGETIEASSEQGKSTEFKFTLSLSKTIAHK